jgi:predicted alpha/beta hydrolase
MQVFATAGTSSADDVQFYAADQRLLGATLFRPNQTPFGTVIIHGATATPQSFYRRFAHCTAVGTGARVLTYDYRGVGRSRPRRLRGDPATMSEWATLDAAAAHAFARERFGDEPIALVGHSFGGQLIGLLDQANEAAAAVMVGVQFGYYGHWPRRVQLRMLCIWRVLVPVLTRLYGYLPGSAGLGEDLPRGVAQQWARWCTHPDYLISEHADARERFARFDRPVLFYTFTDDKFAPSLAVTSLLEHLPAAKIVRAHIDPAEHGGAPIGHFGFFRSRFAPSLWQEAAVYLRDAIEGRTPQAKPTAPRYGS